MLIVSNLSRGLEVHPVRIRRRLEDELPFMATEALIVRVVQQGGDRQAVHEVIRAHSLAAARAMKDEGAPNDLLERLANDPAFGVSVAALREAIDPSHFVGRAPQQVDEFLAEMVEPRLASLAAAATASREEVRV